LPQYRHAASTFGLSGFNSIQVPQQHYGRSSICAAPLMMRHLGDNVYTTSQPIAAYSSAAAKEAWLQNFRKSEIFSNGQQLSNI